jgi:RNA polymerase sigma-70 factor (ECF subfamily)
VSDDGERPIVRDAVQAVRRGDREAFAAIVKLYERRLFALALMMTRDPAGAEEVAQDAFVRAFLHLDAYDERRPFYPWLSTIAVRLAQNWLVRRTRVTGREASEIDAHTAATGAPDPLHDLIEDESDRTLWRAVSALPSGERTAVFLHYRQGLSVAEIASALGVTAGTVKTQLFRARRSLRAKLEPVPAVRSSG